MKASFLVFCAAAALLLSGCESDVAPGSEVPQKFQRGIRGEGTLVQPDQGTDPIIREQPRTGY